MKGLYIKALTDDDIISTWFEASYKSYKNKLYDKSIAESNLIIVELLSRMNGKLLNDNEKHSENELEIHR